MGETGKRVDPLRGYRFEVKEENNNIQHSGFQSVSGLEVEVEETLYREGTDQQTDRKLPGMVKWTDIVLKRGLLLGNDGGDLFKWMAKATGTDAAVSTNDETLRTDITITLRDRSGVAKFEWIVKAAWPKKLSLGEMNAETSDVLINEITIAHEGWSFKAIP